MVEINAKSGDKVKIRLASEELECTILESYDKSVVLVKLKSGYNIGIPRENVFGIDVLEKYIGKDTDRAHLPKTLGKKSIGLIVTGGTIASKLDPKTGGAQPLTDVSEFAKYYPKIFDKINVKKLSVPFMIASENMSSEHWVTIAEHAKEMLNDSEISGVIITHGSDTLHYTASALSFFLQDLKKPVVLTFSQRSIDRASSDAELNLECAVEMALSNCAEVMIVGHANENDEYCFALRGTKVRKMHTSRRDTFKVVNCSPIAKVWPSKIEFLDKYNACSEGLTKVDLSFSDKVALLQFYPGQEPDILDYYLVQGYKGVVISMTGLGHVAVGDAKHSWEPALKRVIKQGMIVCAAAQTVYGRLNPKVYSNGRLLEELGVIFLEDMLSETAFVKLGWVLGHKNWKGLVREKMLENFSGELNPLLTQ
ncbi:MAG: Glu-tRNA(Gln) amidotransferase subunit GatD [Candidatus Pacearchaeota archaeon]